MTTTLPPPSDRPAPAMVDVGTPHGLSTALHALAFYARLNRLPTPIEISFGLLPDVVPAAGTTSGIEVYCREALDVEAWACALQLPPPSQRGQAMRRASGETWRRYETSGVVDGVSVRVWAPGRAPESAVTR